MQCNARFALKLDIPLLSSLLIQMVANRHNPPIIFFLLIFSKRGGGTSSFYTQQRTPRVNDRTWRRIIGLGTLLPATTSNGVAVC